MEPTAKRRLTRALVKTFQQVWDELGFTVENRLSWRTFADLRQCVRLNRGTYMDQLQVDVFIVFTDLDKPLTVTVDENDPGIGVLHEGLRMEESVEFVNALDFEVDVPEDTRHRVFRRWCTEVIYPWLEEHKSLQEVIDKIDPETGFLPHPYIAGKAFYRFIGRMPKVWPRPL
jgi:hypothetical protein